MAQRRVDATAAVRDVLRILPAPRVRWHALRGEHRQALAQAGQQPGATAESIAEAVKNRLRSGAYRDLLDEVWTDKALVKLEKVYPTPKPPDNPRVNNRRALLSTGRYSL